MPQYERDGRWYEVPIPIALRTVIRGALLNAMAYTNGSQTRAGATLGLSARVMGDMLARYDIPTCYGVKARISTATDPRGKGRRAVAA